MKSLACLFCLPCLFALAAPARADVFTVYPGGSIQAAVNAALVAGGDNEVRVRAGHYVGQVYVGPVESGTLILSGGWLPGASFHSGPEATILDGGGLGRVVNIVATGTSEVVLDNFTITGSNSWNGAVLIGAGTGATVRMRGNIVRDNHFVASSSSSIDAVGIMAIGEEGSRLDISGNQITGNTVAGESHPSGLALNLQTNGYAQVLSNRIRGNWSEGGGGLLAIYGLGNRVDFMDNVVEENGTVGWFYYALWTYGSHIVARRNRFTHNWASYQMDLGGTSLVFSDSLVAANPHGGITVYGCADLHLTNVTVTANEGAGIVIPPGCEVPVSLANSIVYGNGNDLDGSVDNIHSLIGLDPEFLDPAGENYRLDASSRAINAGVSPPPEGELGPLDLDARPRVSSWSVDMGAYETPIGEPVGCQVLDWQDGFEDWPIRREMIACSCGWDAAFQEFNCGVTLPDIFLSVRGPMSSDPGAAIGLEWTIDPWTDVAGPYAMSAEVRVDGKWVPQEWLGPTASVLKRGTLVVEPFKVQLPTQGRGELRTQLKYTRAGAQNPSMLSVEVVLPEPAGKP